MSGTPRDQSAWVLEEFPDRPNAVRWTYQITDKDYKESAAFCIICIIKAEGPARRPAG